MAKGDTQTFIQRGKVEPGRIAVRVKRMLAKPEMHVRPSRGVQPLNHGFFLLERMRAVKQAKRQAAVRAKVRGK